MKEDLKKLVLKLNQKKESIDSVDFMPVMDESINDIGYVHFDLDVTLASEQKDKIELIEKVLAAEIMNKFKGIPLTDKMKGISFIFNKNDLSSLPLIQNIGLKLTKSSYAPGIIGSNTTFTFNLLKNSKVILDKYKKPENLSFLSLILPPKEEKKIILKEKKIEEITLDEIIGTDINDIKETKETRPQIKKLNLNFDDLGIGGLNDQLENIVQAILSRAVNPEALEKLGITDHVKGVLLYGPPGTGKTLIARKISEMLGVRQKNFEVVNGPEVLSKYVGESEENIRKLFEKAENNPKELFILFFDEFDAIASQRSSGGGTGDKVGNNLVNQLLSKMDGVKAINNMIVIGATNRIDLIDAALKRPGRFSLQLNINLPDKKGRESIFQIHLKNAKENKGLSEDVAISVLAEKTQNYTGAEIKGVCDQARLLALKEGVKDPNQLKSIDTEKLNTIDISKLIMTMEHFETSLDTIKPAFGQNNDLLTHYFPLCDIVLSSQQTVLKKLQYKVESSLFSKKVLPLFVLGGQGCGKSALAGAFVKQTLNYFDLSRLICPHLLKESFLETLKRFYQEAESVDKSLLVLDNLEELLKLTNDFKYSESSINALNTLFSSTTKGKVIVLSTMTSDSYSLFKNINQTMKEPFILTLKTMDSDAVGEILKKFDIHCEGLENLLQNQPIEKVLEIVSDKKTKDFSLEQWQERIDLLN